MPGTTVISVDYVGDGYTKYEIELTSSITLVSGDVNGATLVSDATFNATTGADTFTGNIANDTVNVTSSTMTSNDTYTLKGGYNIVNITGGGTVDFGNGITASGIDEIKVNIMKNCCKV